MVETKVFFIKDIECETIVEITSRKDILGYLDEYIDNCKYDWFDASDDVFMILYKDGSSEYINEEYDGHKIKRINIESIVYTNACTDMVFGNFSINEFGVVTPSFEMEISNNIIEKKEDQEGDIMRKTNSKEVKAAVRKYLLECDEITIVEMKERFLQEYGHEIRRRGEINACIEWLRGLSIGCAFYYHDIVKLLADWLDDTEDNQWKWLDKKGDDLYWMLLAREIVASK